MSKCVCVCVYVCVCMCVCVCVCVCADVSQVVLVQSVCRRWLARRAVVRRKKMVKKRGYIAQEMLKVSFI